MADGSWRIGRGRTPDPDRPGRVYRARPRFLTFGRGTRAGYGQGGSPRGGSPRGGSPRGGSPQGGSPQGGGSQGGYPPPPPPPGYPRDPQYPPPPPPPGRRSPSRQVPDYAQGPGGVPPYQGRPPGRRRRRRWPVVAVVLLLLVGYPALLGVTALSSLTRVAAFPASGRAADTPGRTFLVVGSDSRQDLSREERDRLGTGGAGGQRTDTIMLLHVPSGGGPTVLVSLPRDSYVPVPGKGKHKINAAYSLGGPQLLVRTVEQATGLRIDDYVETGLGGYANLVDAIGGVRICVKRAMKDDKAHINLKAGCQQMDGTTALGYARARYSDPRGDLGRVERQREVLAAIAGKTLSASVLAVPWRAFPAARAGGGALTVDEGTTPVGITRFVLAMRGVSGGNGLSLTVPISGDISTPDGDALQWDTPKARTLFKALATDNTEAVRPLVTEQKKATG